MAAGGGPLSITAPLQVDDLERDINILIRNIKVYDAKPAPAPNSQNTNYQQEAMDLRDEWKKLYAEVQDLEEDEPARYTRLKALLSTYELRFGEESQGNEPASPRKQGGGRRTKKSKSKSKSKSKKSKSKSKSKRRK